MQGTRVHRTAFAFAVVVLGAGCNGDTAKLAGASDAMHGTPDATRGEPDSSRDESASADAANVSPDSEPSDDVGVDAPAGGDDSGCITPDSGVACIVFDDICDAGQVPCCDCLACYNGHCTQPGK